MVFDGSALIWLTAGVGIGLSVAMAGFALMSRIDRARLVGRLRSSAAAPAAAEKPTQTPAALLEAKADAPAAPAAEAAARVLAIPAAPAEPAKAAAADPTPVATPAIAAELPALPPAQPPRSEPDPEPAASPSELPEVPIETQSGPAEPAVPILDDVVIEPPRPVKPKRPLTEKEKAIAEAAARRRAAQRAKEEAEHAAAARAAEEAEARRLAQEKAAFARAEAERRAMERAAIEEEQRQRERQRELEEAEALARRKAAAERVAQKEAAKKAAAARRMEELAAALRAQAESEARENGLEVQLPSEPGDDADLAQPRATPAPVLIDKEEERKKIARRAAELRAEGARREASLRAAQGGANVGGTDDATPANPATVDVEDLFAQAFSASVKTLGTSDSSGKP